MSQTAGAEATKRVDVVFVVNQLHFRESDTGHNSARVRGVFRNKTDAVACLNKAYEERLAKYGYDKAPIDPDSNCDEEYKRISEEGDYEADTDEFRIEECEIHES
jgi:hypothetical protein